MGGNWGTLLSHMTLGELFHPSVPQSPLLKCNNNFLIIKVLGSSEELR